MCVRTTHGGVGDIERILWEMSTKIILLYESPKKNLLIFTHRSDPSAAAAVCPCLHNNVTLNITDRSCKLQHAYQAEKRFVGHTIL